MANNGSKNFNYLHTIVKDNLSKLAVLVSIETKNDSDNLKTFGKQLSMHIAASSPLAVEANSIKKEVLEKEITLISEELKGTGKPENIIKKFFRRTKQKENVKSKKYELYK